MKKIETIWHHLLWSVLEKKDYKYTQVYLARYFSYSLSTVNLAIRKLSEIGAVRVSGKFFVVSDFKKILFYWATHRKLNKDIIYQTRIDLPVLEIEGLIPPQGIFAGFSAARQILNESPADYSKVFFYLNQKDIVLAQKRFPEAKNKAQNNIFILKSYPGQINYGKTATIPQTFVDIWSLSDWYAKDFVANLEEKIDGLLP